MRVRPQPKARAAFTDNHLKPTRVPLASSVVEGLMNQRGQVVLAMDLRRRLRLPERPAEQMQMIVSVLCHGRTVNLLVGQIGDVIRTTSEQFREVPQPLKGNWPRTDPVCV